MNTRTLAGVTVGFPARIARFMERTSRRGVDCTNRSVRQSLFQIIHLALGSLAFGGRLSRRYADTMTGAAVPGTRKCGDGVDRPMSLACA